MEDSAGFSVFYDASRDELYAALLATLADPQLAREALDEGLTRAAERWPQVRTMHRPAGWVYRVAVNWATSWRRKWSLRPTRPLDTLDGHHHDTLPDLDLARQLSTLPLPELQVLMLRYALEYSIEETAAVLGVAPSTVTRGVRRARERLTDQREVTDGFA